MKHGYPYTKTIAHRGAGSLAPENTMAALRMAHTQGFGAVEFDVMLSNDDIPMLNHDHELGRTIKAQGAFNNYLSSHLSQLDAGSYHSAEFLGESVPTLYNALNFCIQHDLWVNLEIKPNPNQDILTATKIAQVLTTILAQRIYTKPLRLLVSSFSELSLMTFHELMPNIALGILWHQLPHDWDIHVQKLPYQSVHLNQQHLTQAHIKDIKSKNILVLSYTVNDATTANTLINWGIDGFFSDNPTLLMQY